ncbi:hypothetical protein KP509_15G044700 [Ceratopteris richardii]|uniref:Uncharacterized protein n=1 Tax=Ceratopteris richardii TaxID=49495 RepID=A0A8T2T7P2_CERRI|nr:hypothetical protein KP509_15G044700 [Ceratopteris richardii]
MSMGDEAASVHHDEYKDSAYPPQIRRELRRAESPPGDRIVGIAGGTLIHSGNIALHRPSQQQIFHKVPPADQDGNEPSVSPTDTMNAASEPNIKQRE